MDASKQTELPFADPRSDPSRGVRVHLPDGGFVWHACAVVPNHETLLAHLVATLPLAQASLTLFGRHVQTPRLTSWHGNPDCHYRYSGRSFAPEPWTPALLTLRDRVAAIAEAPFNSVLANYYRDGQDAMGAHADDERELGPSEDDVRIASLSLGSTRRFVLSSKAKSHPPYRFSLGSGDLLVMGGTTQRHYTHAVPRTRRAVGPRLNLTFRVIRSR